MTWLLSLGLVLCLLVVAAIGASAYGSKRWSDDMLALTRGLEATRATPPSSARYHSCELDGLPAPVQRYFRTVLKEGQPLIAATTVELAGTINCPRLPSSGNDSHRGNGS